jgi:RecB family exonuclease
VQTASEATAALEENWISAGYSSPEEAAEALSEGRNIIASYVEAAAALPSTANTLFVERQFRLDMGEFVLIGRIDRVDELDESTLEIIDYKSGRSSTDSDELLHDIAMNCYQLLIRSRFPGKRVLSTIIALRTNDSTSAEPDEEQLKVFESDLTALGREMLNRDYEAMEPTWKPICSNCDFLTLCLRHPEFAEQFNEMKAQGD